MDDKKRMNVRANRFVLKEVTLEHFSDSDKEALANGGFRGAEAIAKSDDPVAVHAAVVNLVKEYLKEPA